MHFFNQGRKRSHRGSEPSSGRKENTFLRKVLKLKKTIPNWKSLFSAKADDSRAEQWVRLSVLAAPLSDKFAWAIPNLRALSILGTFGPLVEIGAGKGYWGHLLEEEGIDIICVDKYVPEDTWTEVCHTIG
jgi:hypothetical protein